MPNKGWEVFGNPKKDSAQNQKKMWNILVRGYFVIIEKIKKDFVQTQKNSTIKDERMWKSCAIDKVKSVVYFIKNQSRGESKCKNETGFDTEK